MGIKPIALTIILTLASSTTVNAASIDFEEINPPAGWSRFRFDDSAILSNNFIFSPANKSRIYIMDDGQPYDPNSGTNSLQASAADSVVTITEVTGLTFNLDSFLASEGLNKFASSSKLSATSIQIEGIQADGTIVTSIFNFDDAQENPVSGFEEFMPSGFTNLTSLTITGLGGRKGNSFNIDNLNLTVTATSIPVPAAVWLFGSGLISLIGVAKRKKA